MTHLYRNSFRAFLAALAVVALAAVTMTLVWAEAPVGGEAAGGQAVLPRQGETGPAAAAVLYIYRHDTATAADFLNLLTTAGFGVTTVGIGSVPSDLKPYAMFIIADDTGSLNTWGEVPADLDVISRTVAERKPIVGLGEGGYAFFGKAGAQAGWPRGWHGPMGEIYVQSATGTYFSNPNDLSALVPGTFRLYGEPVNEVAIYKAVAPLVTPIAWEPKLVDGKPDPDHMSLTLEGCYHLWGFSGGPSRMNDNGKQLFVNAMTYMSTFQCPAPPPPPNPNCVTLVKSDNPVSGASVNPGDLVQYTLSYTVSQSTQCSSPMRALLVDQVPGNTMFVPGSAGPGIAPGFGGVLTWDLGPLLPGSTGSKSFATTVLDTACNGPQFITNTAELKTDKGTFVSNVTTHKVNCPTITLPNQDPPYAEREIQVYPYPLVAGRSTRLSVLVSNSLTATSQTVTVTFQTSPQRFGIGIAFNDLPGPGNPRVVTIPAHGSVEVRVDMVPTYSGLGCVRVKIEGAGFVPIYTWRNLDVTEDLRPGVQDTLNFQVGNPTAATADITLVVDNACPGWSAVVSPTVVPSVGPNSGDMRPAQLIVTPPDPATLGTGCHIDVQGWIGQEFIGGIRKLDVPPVHLTPANPPWLEQEISTIPTVPISGTANRVCVELQNPLSVTKAVTVTYSEAVFGAGIGFTPFITRSLDLPPNSFARYCEDWTPIPTTAMHRCLLVTLHQTGFLDQRSQLNVDIVRPPAGTLPVSLTIPIDIGNPLLYTSTITLDASLVGLSGWTPAFTPALPLVLGPGGVQRFTARLVPAVMVQETGAAAAPAIFGDVARLDVTLLLDGEPSGGFSVEFSMAKVYMPLVIRSN